MTPAHLNIVHQVHNQIVSNWSEEEQKEFFLSPWIDGDESSLTRLHHSLGRHIRNEYKLWTIPWEPEMKEFMGCMCDCSPFHPDAVSTTIIREVWKLGAVSGL